MQLKFKFVTQGLITWCVCVCVCILKQILEYLVSNQLSFYLPTVFLSHFKFMQNNSIPPLQKKDKEEKQ